jgi:acyl transferase domain-containing protein/NAD(P)-dependent dehydrogenase (short-subunit alcohol dehydrogenase family)
MRSMATIAEADTGIAFTFPGQGSYSYAVLRELYTSYPQTVPYFHLAQDIGRELLKGDFLSLVTAPSAREHDERLQAHPDLDQLGIYLTEVLIAQVLIESGIKPTLLVGHSFGELAALAAGGAYSIETGLRIVCQRVLALEAHAREGRMAAVSCDPERARRFIEELGDNSIEISVINHPKQTVLSGKPSELEQLRAVLNRQGVSLTLLKSKYPYHSSFLGHAVTPFRTALEAFQFKPASIPVYLSMEGVLYSPGSELPQILSSQFVRTLHFNRVVSGYRRFIECGAGDIVTRLIGQNLSEQAGNVAALTTAMPEAGLREGLRIVLDSLGKSAHTGAASESVAPAPTGHGSAQLLEQMSRVVSDMSQLVWNTSLLIERVSASLLATESAEASPSQDFAGHESPVSPAAAQPEQASATAVPPVPPVAEEKAAPPDTRQVLMSASGSNGSNGHGAPPEVNRREQPEVLAQEECAETPIAIVSVGSVLPGAQDPEQYWSNILNGVSGVSNLADKDPSTAQDFLAGHDGPQVRIIPDKTYTLLHGSISSVPYDGQLLSHAYSQEEFDALTKGQKLLALAVAQSLSRMKVKLDGSESKRMQCIFGATADGSKEYDDALFLESLQIVLGTVDEPEGLRRAFAETLEEISGYKAGDAEKLTQHKIYSAVIERLLGKDVPTYVVDTACSSSLYSTYLGMKALQDGECDLVLAGGVFAPGPANNTLFAQFRGLTHRESRPFDVNADGVVFGDGAGIAILKRLPDALAAGDRVLAVIRGVGLSSDGKSPAINVPQAKGQGVAIRNAYDCSGVDVNTVQYVEAHATATLVGDAVEFNALKETMQRAPSSPTIELGSVKALIGHTGWAAGMASLIKICKAFEARIIPRQYNYVRPSPEIDLAHSQFTIPEASHPWPENVAPYPRRASINGFGFGGTNAHLILEDFDEAYHRSLCARLKSKTKTPAELAVISIGSLFPSPDGQMTGEPSSAHSFKREALRLPAKKMLLPDVTEHMDASQYLAALAAEKAFSTMPEGWMRLKNNMGVVLGLESKTERGMRANERIFADRLRRQVRAHGGNAKISGADLNRILDKLVEAIHARNVPSGPYTLPGLMPNVTAGRVANMFDLHGPNIVIDMGRDSLLQSLFVARQLLSHNACQIVLAGGINAHSANASNQAEAVLLLALTTTEVARREGFPVLSTLSFIESDERASEQEEFVQEINPGLSYKGAQGASEILKAINQAREKGLRYALKQPGSGPLTRRRLVFASAASPASPALLAKQTPAQADESRTHAYVQGTPILYYTPRLMRAEALGEPKILKGRKILFLTDQPERWSALESSGALAALDYKVVCPPGARLANSLPLDLTSEESIQSSLSKLDGLEFDTLIAVKALEGQTKETLLLNSRELVWLDQLFAVCRQGFERIQSRNVPVIAVCQGAYMGAQLDPYTGLVGGFMKSLSRELAGPVCRAVNTDEANLYAALRQVEIELGHTGNEVEVCYRAGARSTFALAPVEKLAADNQPYLDSDSVVIATGGARGVTAVLVEELLRRFGCRVIALGRTETSSVPEAVREMDEQDFQNYEAQFYRDELARAKGRKMPELKRLYRAYRAVNEVCQVTKRMQAISGKYEYQSIDITSESDIDEVVSAAFRKYGRVDLVLHGAGIQISSAITKKSLSDFRKIIATKLGGLSYLYKACRKYEAGRRTHFHILTSVFSYMGNDGQPDYGAANEAMSRIADCMNSPQSQTYWSAMAWLGWAGIGMTRDSEFAALAASRRLRGVTKEEGQQIFAELMKGTPTTPVNILLAEGEIEYYKVAIQSSSQTVEPVASSPANLRRDFYVAEREITIESIPYLLNHLVDGVPTLPGAFIISVVGEAAQQLRPELKVIAFEKAHFRRFVKVYRDRKTLIRIEAQVISEDAEQTVVRVRILSDFVHSSGVVLQKDIVQHEILVRMSTAQAKAPVRPDLNGVEGQYMPDPYVMDGSPVCLSGPFKTMKNIVSGGDRRRADYQLSDFNRNGAEHQAALPKIVLMDSLWRFGAIQIAPDNSLPVFVPEECDVMKIYFDFADFDASKSVEAMTFSGANPRLDGDRLCIGPIAASDLDGNTLLIVEGGVCRRFGEVKNGSAH